MARPSHYFEFVQGHSRQFLNNLDKRKHREIIPMAQVMWQRETGSAVTTGRLYQSLGFQ